MADQTERLLLQVDAATELLRRHLAEGEQPLDRFEARARKMGENVDRAIGDMGKRFSTFGALAESAADRAQKSFESSFSQAQRLAATAVKGPTIEGRVNLGADDIRAGAAAAQEQARAFALIGEAAERTAIETRDTSEATRLFIAATSASRIEAEQKAAALLAEAGALERVEIELLQSAEATELFVNKHKRIAEAAAEEQRLAASSAEAAREQRSLASSADALRASIDPMYAAQQRFDAELTRADALLAAGSISTREYEAAVRLATAALQTHAAQVTGVADRQRALAATAAEAARNERALASAADLLRSELDPMYAAQKRFDDELNRADALLRAGTIHQREYDAAVSQARANLYAHAQAVAGSTGATTRLTSSQGALRAAMTGVSYQVQDTFTQISMGANILNVVAIQGGQLAGQFANIEGKAGNFARFMIGPYGLAITAALLITGPLVSKIFDLGSELDKAVDKQKKDAEATDIARRAKLLFSTSLDGVTAALRDQDEALRKTAENERSAAERANIAAKSKRDEALAIRQATAARLADAVSQAQAFQRAALAEQQHGKGDGATFAAQIADARVNGLQDQLAKANEQVTKAERELNVSRVDLAAEQAATAIDPVKAVTKLYDDRIKALKDQQREEARLGAVVGAQSKQRLQELEAQKKAAIDAAQAKVAAAKRTASGSGNNQLGREISVSEARAIVASIGGTVTSGLRTHADQERIYADKLAGRHAGPVAVPGTSDHERGQAVDIAYGPGITIAKIREAFAKQGVALRQILDEPAQHVFHVAFGKKGASQESVDKKEEAARVKKINDDLAYNQEEKIAQKRLTEATRHSALTEEQRDQAIRDDINDQADAENRRIAGELDEGKISKAQADHLKALNEGTRTQQLANAKADAGFRKLSETFEAQQDDLQSRLAMLRISEDMAVTEADRRKVSREILDIEQELRRKALERERDTSQDPAVVQRAKTSLAKLPALDKAEDQQLDKRNAGPLDQYKDRLKQNVGDINESLQRVAANGLGRFEDAASSAIGSAVTNFLHLKGVVGEVASSVISDLARIAAEKLILSAFGGSFLGLKIGNVPGHATGVVPGFADGIIRGPGTGTSDSILGHMEGKGLIRVSNGESILTAAATQANAPWLRAMNRGLKLPAFATGVVPNLRSPQLPDLSAGNRGQRLAVDLHAKVDASEDLNVKIQSVAARTVGAAAEPIMLGAKTKTIRALNRPVLPGGWG
ncbi:D-alanyl-D-alanine carboxypeptidase family protein [Sphingomonas sp. BAUL-RG-20F-R05-02]|uniref:D-alanyl-D-alanine carboxypeptidase family protein n=1 Tax=Sphingomonas sp. BAUL-RG-20F-R05-02 TaxID=2914830 RepID=UPI001F571B18|nr:D-alanyl-D-alanine carboxypeptidase family protein [Sphingomonas sp. BAUL-RG-20F-R05-02]